MLIVPFQLIDLIHPNKVSLVDEQLFLRTSSLALARQYTSKVKREKFVKQRFGKDIRTDFDKLWVLGTGKLS